MEVTNTAAEEQFKRWAGRIHNVAVRTIPKCHDPLYSIADIKQRLREAVWKATVSWKEDRGMSLSSWTYFRINQEASLVTMEQYRYCRDRKGNSVPTFRIGQEREIERYLEGDDECEVQGFQIVDPWAEGKVDTIEQEELKEKVREVIPEGQKRDIYNMLVSGEYKSNRAIADELGIGTGKVDSVRLKAKIALALILNIPLKRATDSKYATEMARRFPALWARYSLRV